jgi:arsenite oxidase small subunit
VVKAGGVGVAGLVAASALPGLAAEATAAAYPVLDVAPLASIVPGASLAFSYPDDDSSALLVRLSEPGMGGVGPNREIVAFSVFCTHKGCPVDYRADRRMLICPCHWSTFDPAKAGAMVIGQGSAALPQISLEVKAGTVRATGITGLIYGRHTNIV